MLLIAAQQSPLLDREEQMAREVAVFVQAVSSRVGDQVDGVALLQREEGVPRGAEVAALLGGVRVEDELVVALQINAPGLAVDGAVELELVDTRRLADEHALLDVVCTLPVVDHVAEDDGHFDFGVTRSQSNREADTRRGPGRPGWAWGSLGTGRAATPWGLNR